METKKTYEEKKEAAVRDWSKKLEDLKKKADQGRADMKIKYYEQIEALRPKLENARKKLDELKKTSGDKWEGVKNGVEKALNDFRNSFDNTLSKFKR